MYRCERLTYKKLDQFKSVNKHSERFNLQNKDFFLDFNERNLIQKMILVKNVRLLCYDKEYVGSIWSEKLLKNHYLINSLCFSDFKHCIDGINTFINCFRSNTVLTYNCEKNDYNFDILEKIGFIKDQGTFELEKDIFKYEPLAIEQDISFESFKKGQHEKVRCDLQNNIFMNDNREPLTIDDIYYDVNQDYYIEQGSIFIKYKNEYIGYGQIIMDEGIPTIVNFGVLKNFRKNGYGKLLISYLFNLMYQMKYTRARIKVYSENYAALNLYLSMGFEKIKEYYKWNYLT